MQKDNKVAEITLLFWLMKVIATTLGETLGDFFSMTLNLGYLEGIEISLTFFVIVLILQLSVNTFIPVCYWLVIIGTTTLGTEISDFLDRTLHLGYAAGSLLLGICLLISLVMWYKKYGNLELYPVFEKQKELYYWTAILFSNSLGTAFGDFLTDNAGFSYIHGAMLTSGIIVAVILLHYFSRISPVILFWIAFVFTRPFGATFGDFLTKPASLGGLNLSRFYASLTSLALISLLLILSSIIEKRKKHDNSNL